MKNRWPQTVTTKTLGDNPQDWANLGYWFSYDLSALRKPPPIPPLDSWPEKSYEKACTDLAAIHGACAQLEPDHRLLEIACGRGASVQLWVDGFRLNRIDLMEPCPLSSAHLQTRWSPGSPHSPVQSLFHCRLEDALHGVQKAPSALGSAGLRIPHRASYDRMVCVDSAYHFSSTEDLLDLARQCLRPGGIVVWSTFTFDRSQGPGLGNRGLPPWLSWLGIQEKSLVDLSNPRIPASQSGFDWHPPWILDEGVIGGFARFVSARRRRLSWFQKLSLEWLKIEATALALNQLNLGDKGIKSQDRASSSLWPIGYAVFSATLR